MKTKPMQLGRWAAALLLCSPILTSTVHAQEIDPCSPSWYLATPPNPDWGLPPTIGEMFPLEFYDVDEAKAFFLVPLAGLQSLLPPGVRALEANADISPWNYLGPSVAGFGILGVAVWQVNSTEYLEPYRSMCTLAMIDDPAWREGFNVWYIHYGVINSEAAQWLFAAAYGAPFILGDAHFQSVKPKGLKAFASADNELILSIELPTEDMVLASVPNKVMFVDATGGSLTGARIFGHEGTRYSSWAVGATTLKLGQHPIAQQLREIGFGMYPCIWQAWSKHMVGTWEKISCEPLPGPSAN